MSTRPMVVGEPAADRLMRSLDYRLHPEAAPLSKDQVAVVLHALSDHTALSEAARHDPRPSEDRFSPESSIASNVGRWMHAVADDLTGFYTGPGTE